MSKDQDELLANYAEKLEIENRSLKSQLNNIRRPLMNREAAGVLVVGALIAISLISIIYLIHKAAVGYKDEGKFYVGTYTSDRGYICHRVYHEFDWASDDSVTECTSNIQEAYKLASEHRTNWKLQQKINQE